MRNNIDNLLCVCVWWSIDNIRIAIVVEVKC